MGWITISTLGVIGSLVQYSRRPCWAPEPPPPPLERGPRTAPRVGVGSLQQAWDACITTARYSPRPPRAVKFSQRFPQSILWDAFHGCLTS
jgi:hypothetical protein